MNGAVFLGQHNFSINVTINIIIANAIGAFHGQNDYITINAPVYQKKYYVQNICHS